MKVLLTGSSGLVGCTLLRSLKEKGHEVFCLVRRRSDDSSHIFWDPSAGEIDAVSLEGIEGVIHLAGENIAGGRWNAERKRKIRDSRVKGTELIAKALAGLKKPPQVLVCASAVGFYGDRGDEVLTEESPPGTGFLPDVCRDWENAALSAVKSGIRVCSLRFGIILSPEGGALAKMLTPFKLGLGGVMGSGDQYWSWISIDDAVGALLFCLTTESLKGPVNGVSPQPLTNREFTKILGRALKRPTLFPMPAFAARLILGEMADALLLASARVEPRKLSAVGYRFRHTDLQSTLKQLILFPEKS